MAMLGSTRQTVAGHSSVVQQSHNACSPNIVGSNNKVICSDTDLHSAAKLDEALLLLKSEQFVHRFQSQFPLGYTVFELNSVTESVTPIDTHRELGEFGFDFHPVRVEVSGPQITIQLPDLTKNGKPTGSNPQVGGDRESMQKWGSGYIFEDNHRMISATCQVLQFNGDVMIWIFGLRDMGPFPSPTAK